ncbi:MAG: 50S ribosomal protein L10 [Candidatus Peregrinibacteria bacterium]|nr:50S ribosomal protein L10 [Candidatus Peregrinibacteria bacterium]
MAVSRTQKAQLLSELKTKLKDASSVLFAHYIGLKVSEVSELRRKLKVGGAEMKVTKKTLLQIAAKDVGLPEFSEESIPGPIACIFSFQDPAAGASIAFTFGKDHPQVVLMGGCFDGKLLSKEDARTFAQIPSRLVLLATFAGMIRSPLTKFASMCNSPLISFARATGELAKKKGT